MVTTVRAEAVITAQNKLRPGLSAAARDLERFRAQEKARVAAFASAAGRMLGAVGGAFSAIDGARRAFASSVSMEREMYNVQRATDATSETLKQQEQFLLDLARATGKTKEELAQLYAAAGFAGRPVQELGQFTEYASKATVAWGTNAQETGQALAEIGNIYSANQKRIEAIGDVINTVADSSASGEKDLIEILRRVGGAGQIVGISAENMLAFGAALKEVGVGTEVASTGLNAMLTKISVPDDKFDEALGKAGLKPKAFRKSVEKNATGAILDLLGALKKLEGTKRIAVLKDLFGMEYADDIARLVGGYERINKLLAIANDRTKTLGSVRQDFAVALEKDFNKLDRATQSIDVLMKHMGDGLKEVAGGFAEVINKAVDSSEIARKRLDRLKDIEREAEKREGKPETPARPATPGPLDPEVMNQRARESVLDPRTDEKSLHGLALYGGTEEIRNAAEDALRRKRFERADREGYETQGALWGKANDLLAGGFGAPANRMDNRIAAGVIKAAELGRITRMQREFEDMRVVSQATSGAKGARTGLASAKRLDSFSDLPLTISKGKGAKTYVLPKLDGSSAGATAGSEFVNALNAELDRGITETEAKIERLKSMLRFSASPSIDITVRAPGTGLGGLPVGKQGPN